jgi:hypothetical protein
MWDLSLQWENSPAATGHVSYYVECNLWKYFFGVNTLGQIKSEISK